MFAIQLGMFHSKTFAKIGSEDRIKDKNCQIPHDIRLAERAEFIVGLLEQVDYQIRAEGVS